MKLIRDVTAHDEPQDRLTRIAARLLDAFRIDPEYREDDCCIIMLDEHSGRDERRGGICVYGYDDNADAMANMLGNLQALFAGFGMRVDVVAMDDDGVSRFEG